MLYGASPVFRFAYKSLFLILISGTLVAFLIIWSASPIVLAIYIGVWIPLLLALPYITKLMLKLSNQWSKATLEKGRLKPSEPPITWRARLRGFLPTLLEWRWLVALWILFSILDIVSTLVALRLGAVEGNPWARTGFESSQIELYIVTTILAIFVVVVTCLFRLYRPLKVGVITAGLVVLSNFAVVLSLLIQPEFSIGSTRIEPSAAIHLIHVGKYLMVSIIFVYRKEIIDALKKGRNGVYYLIRNRENGR